jgi:hypothetical protein
MVQLSTNLNQNIFTWQIFSEFSKSTNGGHVGRFLKTETARMTMSHPALLMPPKTPPSKPRGIMDRKDIFFRGSLHNIPMAK